MPVGNIIPSIGVKRCLFGPVDHEQRSKELSRLSKALDQTCCQRWNFNFNLETPMSGKYTWEQVVTEDHVPKAYEMTNLETVRRFSRVTISPKSEEISESVSVDQPANSSLVSDGELSHETLQITRPSTPKPKSKSRKRKRETDEQLSQRLITGMVEISFFHDIFLLMLEM